jgi:hypothetical protein
MTDGVCLLALREAAHLNLQEVALHRGMHVAALAAMERKERISPKARREAAQAIRDILFSRSREVDRMIAEGDLFGTRARRELSILRAQRSTKL